MPATLKRCGVGNCLGHFRSGFLVEDGDVQSVDPPAGVGDLREGLVEVFVPAHCQDHKLVGLQESLCGVQYVSLGHFLDVRLVLVEEVRRVMIVLVRH